MFVFDFQPKDPENILAPLAVISQRKLPGTVSCMLVLVQQFLTRLSFYTLKGVCPCFFLSILQGSFSKEKFKEYPEQGVGLLDFQRETHLKLQTHSTETGRQTYLSARTIVDIIPMVKKTIKLVLLLSTDCQFMYQLAHVR